MQFLGRRLRHECKYYIHPHEYLALRSRMLPLLALDPNSRGQEGYNIRSLYFDDPLNFALTDKADGIFGREKFRIRIYNGSDATIKLERKSKFGDYVCKEAARLSRADYDRILNGDCSSLQQSSIPVAKDFYRAITHRGFRPTAIVDYTREAYIYDYEDVRITFDKKLSAAINTLDLFSGGLALTEALEAERSILEIKFNRFLPEPIRLLTRMYAHNRSAISKYQICREVGMKHFKP